MQINHLVDRQNSLAQNPSALATDLPTPGGAAWTPFTPNEWSSTWSTTANNQNPFAQRQLSKDDSTLWSGGINMKDSWLNFHLHLNLLIVKKLKLIGGRKHRQMKIIIPIIIIIIMIIRVGILLAKSFFFVLL